MEELIERLSRIYKLSDECKVYLRTILERTEYKKEQIILREGRVCLWISYIESGIVRIHFQQGREDRTSWILKAGEFFITVASFFMQKPSRQRITAVTDCVVWGITHAQLEKICQDFPEFLWVRVRIMEKYYSIDDDKHMDLFSVSPKERYMRLMETSPELFDDLLLKYVRSFLGITKSTWHRIRSNYGKKK